jgi:hypothetical protein
METQQYKLRVIKEILLNLDSEDEAEQILDLLAGREGSYNIAGNKTFVYTELEVAV